MNNSICSLLLALCLAAPVVAQETTPVLPAPPPQGAPLTAADVDAWLEGFLPYAIHSGDIAGAVVAVVKDGEILTEHGYGFADVEKRLPIDPQLTLFRPGSVSKLVTWTAVMQLVEQGKIDLDADVNRYLDFRIPRLDGQPVTMRNLMQHTAGFEEQAKGIIFLNGAPAPTFDVLLKRWVPERVFVAGKTPAYSNYGASLAGYIVQRVSGEPFDDYVERHIFAPLDMTHSTFRQPLPPRLAPLMSQGYLTASADEPCGFEVIGPAPAGALSAPAEDMAHFMIAHLQNGEYHGRRILQAATAAQMHDSPLTLLPPLNRMELGFFETNINDREVIAHLGDTECFHTSLHLFLKENVGFYVSFNSLGRDGAAESLRGALFEGFADRYFPGQPVRPAVDAKSAAQHVKMLSGTWVNSRRAQTNFMAGLDFLTQIPVGVDAKGGLSVPFPGLNGKPRQWVEIAPFVWRDVNGYERLAAKVEGGRVARFSFDGISPFMVFDRVPWYADSAWLRPLFWVALGALLLTVLVWPVAAVVRRRYGMPLVLEPRAGRAYRLSKLAALATVAMVALWGVMFMLLIKSAAYLNGGLDPLLWVGELLGTLVFIGGVAAMAWNSIVVWRGRRRWPARVWSVVLTGASLVVLWVALVFKLISFGTHY